METPIKMSGDEVVVGEFRARFCECGKQDGKLHLNVWYGENRYGPFDEAVSVIIVLIQLVLENKLDKYKAMRFGWVVLGRLPTSAEPVIPAIEAEELVLKKFPGLDPDIARIVEKIFEKLKIEEAEYARMVFKPIPLSHDREEEPDEDVLAAAG